MRQSMKQVYTVEELSRLFNRLVRRAAIVHEYKIAPDVLNVKVIPAEECCIPLSDGSITNVLVWLVLADEESRSRSAVNELTITNGEISHTYQIKEGMNVINSEQVVKTGVVKFALSGVDAVHASVTMHFVPEASALITKTHEITDEE